MGRTGIVKKYIPKNVRSKIASIRQFYWDLRGAYYRKINTTKKKPHEKLRVAFVVCYPEEWNSLKTVYEAIDRNSDAEALILAVPNKDINMKNEMYTFLCPLTENVVNAYLDGKWFELKKFRPHFVFQQTPHDQQFPTLYRSSVVAKYSRVCYIPYGFSISSRVHLDISYNNRFMANVYAIYADNSYSGGYVKEKIAKHYFWKGINIFECGYPRFDLLMDGKEKNNAGTITYTYIPRWSLDNENNDASTYFQYIDFLLSYFTGCSDKKLIIRPHPLMFSNFKKLGRMSETDIQDVFDRVSHIPNISFDSNKNYLETFSATDVLIADFSSLIVEFALTGRPVLYLGKTDGFYKVNKNILDTLIYVNGVKNLKYYLDMGTQLYGVNAISRRDMVKGFIAQYGDNAGERIANSLFLLTK